MDSDLLPARMVNEFVYCPRLFYLEWVESRFTDNDDTRLGQRVHRRVDEEAGAAPLPEEGELRRARSVTLSSERLGVVAKLDVIEGHDGAVVPVDFKKGSPQPDGNAWPSDEVQVLLQGLLLREHGYRCDHAELWYAEIRRRVRVDLTEERLSWARDLVSDARGVAEAVRAPLPLVDSPKCPRCSLLGLCLPDETNALLAGAGIAGSLVAKQLGRQGWQVLVLEAGTGGRDTWEGHLDAVETFRSAVAKVPNSPFRRNAAAPSPDVLDLAPNGLGFTANGYFVQNGGLPYGTDYLRAVGGSGMHWMGLCLRMHPDDFATKTRYGYGRDWPIGYDDLEPYYAAAEREIGVAGDAQEQRALGIRSDPHYVYPMHKIPPSYIDEVCRSLDGRAVHDPVAAEDFTLKVFSVPHGRNSTPDPRYAGGLGYRPTGAVGLPNYGERCVGNASCVPFCPVQARWTPLRTQAEFADCVTLAPRCVVTGVINGRDGRIKGVEYRTYDDPASAASRPYRAEADVVVVAAHSIENARLLLASGLASGSGELGRNLMDHPTMLTWALTPAGGGQIGPFRGPGSTSGWEAFRFGDARRERTPFRIEIGNWGWGWAAGAPMSNVGTALGVGGDAEGNIVAAAVFGTKLRHTLGDQIGRQLQLQFAMEQPADRTNRVTIDDRYRDAMGNPRPVLTYNLSDHVKKGIAAAKRVASAIYAQLGAQEHTDHSPRDGVAPLGYFRYRDQDYTYAGAGHGAGTHIMGDVSTSSVVDSFQRCWDHPNLYAVGCGSMPSVGTSNPSLTMAALALRSAEQIHRDLVELHRPANLSGMVIAEVQP